MSQKARKSKIKMKRFSNYKKRNRPNWKTFRLNRNRHRTGRLETHLISHMKA